MKRTKCTSQLKTHKTTVRISVNSESTKFYGYSIKLTETAYSLSMLIGRILTIRAFLISSSLTLP